MSEPPAIWELQQRIALYEDMQAYKQLYDLLSEGLHRFTCSFVKSREVAEEIVSDVFIKLWQIRGKLTGIENLRVYLYTIARNFSLNYITRNFKNPVISLESMDIDFMASLTVPQELGFTAEIADQIRIAIDNLPPQCKLIFQLVKEEELKYKEVAAILHISPLTVRNQLAIAIRKISEALPAHLKQNIFFSPKFSSS
jgi:RNA polymerase sigma-19 factor, ECF subfamily